VANNIHAELMETADRLLAALADFFLDRSTFADFTPDAQQRALSAVREAANALAAAL
jgi:hypothetical protein